MLYLNFIVTIIETDVQNLLYMKISKLHINRTGKCCQVLSLKRLSDLPIKCFPPAPLHMYTTTLEAELLTAMTSHIQVYTLTVMLCVACWFMEIAMIRTASVI